MKLAILAAVVLVELHGPNGQPLDINPAEVSSLRPPADALGRWAKGTRCVVVMSNGRFNAVAEDCETAVQKLERAK